VSNPGSGVGGDDVVGETVVLVVDVTEGVGIDVVVVVVVVAVGVGIVVVEVVVVIGIDDVVVTGSEVLVLDEGTVVVARTVVVVVVVEVVEVVGGTVVVVVGAIGASEEGIILLGVTAAVAPPVINVEAPHPYRYPSEPIAREVPPAVFTIGSNEASTGLPELTDAATPKLNRYVRCCPSGFEIFKTALRRPGLAGEYAIFTTVCAKLFVETVTPDVCQVAPLSCENS
jgi:hypothetical protein